MAGHPHLSGSEVGKWLPSVQPCHAVIARANRSNDRHHMPGRNTGTIPRPFGPGSCRRHCWAGARDTGAGRHSHMDGVTAPTPFCGEPSGAWTLHDGHHGDSPRAPGVHPGSHRQDDRRPVCRDLHSMPLSPSTRHCSSTTGAFYITWGGFWGNGLWIWTSSWSKPGIDNGGGDKWFWPPSCGGTNHGSWDRGSWRTTWIWKQRRRVVMGWLSNRLLQQCLRTGFVYRIQPWA